MKSIGFLGLGIMGQGMCGNLIELGLPVTVWNRTKEKCEPFAARGAAVGESPADVVRRSDVTIAMVSDPAAARDLYFGVDGVGAGLGPGRDYIDMSTVDAATSRRIDRAVVEAGGRFLEAPVSGTKKPAADGTLVILAAGDAGLYADAEPLFAAMGKRSFFLGETGQAARMKLIVNLVMGGMMASFCEGLALAGRSGLKEGALLDVLAAGALGNPMFAIKGPLIERGEIAPAFPLKHMQKDLRLAGLLGDELEQPLPSAAAANEAFIRARALGLGDDDFSAVYRAIASAR